MRDRWNGKGAADILRVLSDHLGGGASGLAAQQRLMAILPGAPAASRGRGGRLWRGMSVSAEVAGELNAGSVVELEVRPLSFWSRSRSQALCILRERASCGKAEDRYLLLSRDFEPEDVALDVEAACRLLGADTPDFPGLAFAAREREVMIQGWGWPFTIDPADVVAAFSRDDAALWAPAPKEAVALADGRTAIISGPGRRDGTILTDLGLVAVEHDIHGWIGEIFQPEEDPELLPEY